MGEQPALWTDLSLPSKQETDTLDALVFISRPVCLSPGFVWLLPFMPFLH